MTGAPISDHTPLPEDLEELGRALARSTPEIMSLSELDGLLTAIAVCLEEITPQEWLPYIWVDEEVDDEALLNDPGLPAIVARLVQHQRDIAAILADGELDLEPIYAIDGSSDDPLWEGWLEGFELGMSLRPDAWEALHAQGGEGAEAFELLTTLIMLGENDKKTKAQLGPKNVKQLIDTAPDVLPECAQIMYDAARAGPRVPVRVEKIGRNDPCPCGSGKKFKKCCGVG